MVDRRNFLKSSAAISVMASLPLSVRWHLAQAAGAAAGLSDPTMQPKFANEVPDALAPGFIYQPDRKGRYKIQIGTATQFTGLEDTLGNKLPTRIWGYGAQADRFFSWPGRTFQVKRGSKPSANVARRGGLSGSTAGVFRKSTDKR